MADIYHFGQHDEPAERQDVVRLLSDLVKGDGNLKMFPENFKMALEGRYWEHDRRAPHGKIIPPMSFHRFIYELPWDGIGATYEIVERLIGDRMDVRVLYDAELRRGPGGNNNPEGSNQHATKEVNVDNIHVDQNPVPDRPTGTAIDAGLRRLTKGAEAGDSRAQLYLEDVLAGKISTHRACVEMGWRKPTVTVRDDPDALADAACKKAGPVETAMRAWRKMSMEDQEQFLEWASRNMRTVMDKVFS